ncbi:uncharacterized protein DEA37_0007769 [Paragonimus westermani]|uniref:Uncharacterized protein n=1 Tax=Paragonimus westermani TaxID=34504 RepID=A0A5J4NCB7_9TREM|nr:uncharacterized protein DEA37_0007769 [Paragonimus westermani]
MIDNEDDDYDKGDDAHEDDEDHGAADVDNYRNEDDAHAHHVEDHGDNGNHGKHDKTEGDADSCDERDFDVGDGDGQGDEDKYVGYDQVCDDDEGNFGGDYDVDDDGDVGDDYEDEDELDDGACFGKSAHQWHKELSHLEAAHRLFNAKQVEEQLVELRRDIARLELDLRGIGGLIYSETEVESGTQQGNGMVVDTSEGNSAFRQVVGKFLGHALHEQRLLNQWHEIFTERFSEEKFDVFSKKTTLWKLHLMIAVSLVLSFMLTLDWLTDMECADDVVLLDAFAEDMQSMVNKVNDQAGLCGMHSAPSKCKELLQYWGIFTPTFFFIAGGPLETVNNFTYLGSTISRVVIRIGGMLYLDDITVTKNPLMPPRKCLVLAEIVRL